ncbi:hypothetical protein ACN38_g11019, partial [Penicillium nordicum]
MSSIKGSRDIAISLFLISLLATTGRRQAPFIKYDFIQARNLTNEKVFVGDEAGVYARLQKAAGQALGAVFEAQSINIALGDFKSTKLRCRPLSLVIAYNSRSYKDSPTPKLAAKRSANLLQVFFKFTSDSLQIHFRFTSDSLQIHFRFT